MANGFNHEAIIDAFQILVELERMGFSNAEVARLLHVSKQRLHLWKMGSEPRYSDGVRLLLLFKELSNRQ